MFLVLTKWNMNIDSVPSNFPPWHIGDIGVICLKCGKWLIKNMTTEYWVLRSCITRKLTYIRKRPPEWPDIWKSQITIPQMKPASIWYKRPEGPINQKLLYIYVCMYLCYTETTAENDWYDINFSGCMVWIMYILEIFISYWVYFLFVFIVLPNIKLYCGKVYWVLPIKIGGRGLCMIIISMVAG